MATVYPGYWRVVLETDDAEPLFVFEGREQQAMHFYEVLVIVLDAPRSRVRVLNAEGIEICAAELRGKR